MGFLRLQPVILTGVLLTLEGVLGLPAGKSVLKMVIDDNIQLLGAERRVDVAVIGAGPGGAYSAYKLRNTDQNVELFEYSDRVGGRLYTTFLRNIPDLPLETGGMRFIAEVHSHVQQLVKELGLPQEPFSDKHGDPAHAMYYLRDTRLSTDQFKEGDVPYNLRPDEKANQRDIIRYYLRKMTGYNGSEINEEILSSLKATDGRYLYKIPFDEAFDSVATPEGKAFMRAVDKFESNMAPDTSPLSIFENNLGKYGQGFLVQTITTGMSTLPQRLVQAFLGASFKNRFSPNHKLLSLKRIKNGSYKLVFSRTLTRNGETIDQAEQVTVLADKVILAIPKIALDNLDWETLREPRVSEALNAVRAAKASKVFLTFSTPWWLNGTANPSGMVVSDKTFSQLYDWGRSNKTGTYSLLASYADERKAEALKILNQQGSPIDGSAPGAHSVSDLLLHSLFDDLSQVFGIHLGLIPKPLSALSQFWDTYPFGGGWSIKKAGYRLDDVIATVSRPSLSDDVFIVGSDFSFHNHWSEGALSTVERVFDLYFK
ncbi:unnamed protein product [Lymnaea stagnalis]|uniref:Amine oxidase domain-containing protein n=1 Tax=Lymnaea stagnalis TaxID=6523 RepID=A0AAV2HHN4_LYMST